MTEPPRISSVEYLKPKLAFAVGCLVAGMRGAGDPVRVLETARFIERQEWLYASGRTREGRIVTNALPGWSSHTPDANGLASACDFGFEGPEPFSNAHPWALLGKMAEDLGLKWGGRFELRDYGHVELP